MSTVTPPRPVAKPRPNTPRAPSPARMGSNVDPFKVLRRHLWLIIGSAILGSGVGVGAYFACKQFYPLYSARVLFDIRPGIADARDIGASDIGQDQLVLRLAMTEQVLLTSREVLETAMRDPQVRNTQWFQKNFVATDGTELMDSAVDELEEDLKTNVLRNTNLFALRWSTHHANDVPIVLNAIADAYLTKKKTLDTEGFRDNKGVIRAALQQSQDQIQDIDTQISRFIQSKGMDTLSDPRDSQTAYQMQQLAQSITETAHELSMARSGYAQAAAKLEGRIEPTSDDRLLAEQTDPSVAMSIQQIMFVKTELREKYPIYQATHPIIQRLEGRLRALEDVSRRR